MTQTTEDTSRSPTMAELLRVAIEYHTRDMWTALPGQIDKYDAEKQRANVKPLVQDLVVTEDGEEFAESLPVLPDVPVIWPRAGGFYLTLPVKVGDFCLIIFQSRSIDKYLEGDGVDQNPGDFRTHSLTDAVALMGFAPFSKAIADFDNEAAVLGKEKGTRVRVADDLIELGIKDASDKVALDSLVQSELSTITSDLTTLKAAFAAWIPVAMDGGAALKAALGTYPTTPISTNPTASALVTIEK